MDPKLPDAPLPHPDVPPRDNPELDEVQVEMLLAKLSDSIRAQVRGNLDSVITFCQKQKINFSDWKRFDATEHEEQVKSVYKLLGISYTGNREELNTLVSLMETRNEILQEARSKSEGLSDDVMGGAVKRVSEHAKGLFREHPLATIFASGMALWGASLLWNHKTKFKSGDKEIEMPIFKWAVLGTAGAYAVNHLLGPIFGGRDAIDAVMDMPDSKFEELLAGAEGKDNGVKEVDKRAFRAMIHMGQVPFSVFLNVYQRSLNNGNLEMDMRSLQRAARRTRAGRKVPRHYFDPKMGKGLFAEMERLVGGKNKERIAYMQEKYVDNGLNMNLFKVMTAEFNALEDDDEALVASRKGGKKAAGAGGETVSGDGTGKTEVALEAPKAKIDQKLTDELKGIDADLAALHAEVLEGGKKARIMGFTVDIVRTKDDETGIFTYRLDVDPAPPAPLTAISSELSSVDSPPGINAQRIANIKAALEARADRLVKAIEPTMQAPQWNATNGKWELAPLAMPWNPLHFTTLGLTPPSALPLRMDLNENNTVELFYGDQQILSLDDLRETIKEDGVEVALRSQPDTANLFRGLDVEVTDAAVWSYIHINVEGATFTALRVNHPAPGKFVIYGYNLSPQFINAKTRALQERPDFKKIFEDLALSGEKLSSFGRPVMDFLGGRFSSADSKNHYWLQLIELKKFELVYDYEQALRGVNGSGPNLVNDLNKAEERFAQSLRVFKDYPNKLTNSRDNADQYEKLEKEFSVLGYGSEAYKNRTEAFYTKINALNFQGWTEKSSPVHQAMVFNIMRLWYERTRDLKDTSSFSANQQEFLTQLEDSFTGILGRGILTDVSFLQRVREGLNYEEFKKMRPEFDMLPTYMGWQIDTGKTEALIASLPLLGQVGKSFTVIAGPSPAPGSTVQSATIDFGDGTTWTVNFDSSKPTNEQIDLTQINMTPDMVSAHVSAVESSASFKKPFERLDNLWTNMSDTHEWSQLAKGNFNDFIKGSVKEGEWDALVDYKRQEALLDYREALNGALKLSGAALKTREWNTVQDNFGTNYLGGLEVFGREIEEKIDRKLSDNPPRQLGGNDFDDAYGRLQSAGYRSVAYGVQMKALRRDIKTFDYGFGWETLDSRKANEIMNKVIALQHKYMHLMLDKPGLEAKTTVSVSKHFRSLEASEWNTNHEKYFNYVRLEVMHYLRKAHNTNADAMGTWLDHAIGADEIPADLAVLSFNAFVARPDLLNGPNTEADPSRSQPPSETQTDREARMQRFHDALENILAKEFIDPIEIQNKAQEASDKKGHFWNFEWGDVDPNEFKQTETELRRSMESSVEHVGQYPQDASRRLEAFEDEVEASYSKLAGTDSWAPWS